MIGSGDVNVYVFDDRTAMVLASGYAFEPAKVPRSVYEVMPATIPASITRALSAHASRFDNYKWGVSLPSGVQQQISRYVSSVSSGQLLIDRHGRVRHNATP